MDADRDRDTDIDIAADPPDDTAAADAPGLAALEDESTPAFHAPWQARAFAVAVALSDDGTYDWEAFQERLVAEIERDDGPAVPDDGAAAEDGYYHRWLAALERLLVEDGVLESGELTDRAREFADGDRDASEWVAGEHVHGGHDHDHDHDRGYEADDHSH